MFPYNKLWYQSLAHFHEHNERAMFAIMAHLGKPKSYFDAGCGDGWMVRTARMVGVNPAIGVEISPEVQELRPKWATILHKDLSQPLNLENKYELVTCIEVAEHMTEDAADTLVHNLVAHTGVFLVFTAAVPGQGGEGHINCQPQEYWREKFVKAGLIYDLEKTQQLRETWKWATGPMFWLPQNLQVFRVEFPE